MVAMQGLLLVDHGSRRMEANASLAVMAERIRARQPGIICRHAHMELAQPDIPVAFVELVAAGASDIRVVPYFLAPGRHASEDIPRIVAQAAVGFPAVTWKIAECLGPHDLLVELALLRAGLEV
jgi:sirohydrochlorin ferrochelatase